MREICEAVEIIKNNKTAIILGASGLVGGQCLEYLLKHPAYKKVVALGRRKLNITHDRLEQHIIDFDRLDQHAACFEGNDLFSCLGTTMAKAGSKEAFYKVDFTYVYETAQLAAQRGASQLLLVSSVGADPDALFYYSQVKGEIEAAVKKLPFWAIHIFRPSVLVGDREEVRLAERIGIGLGQGLDWLTGGDLLGKYKPSKVEDVVKAMLRAAQKLEDGIWTYPSDHIYFMARKEDKNQKLIG